jgi:hypothetical protein
MSMVCRYCGHNKKLIKAHVIPGSFFRRLRSGKAPPMLLTNNQYEYPKRAPIGVYDKNILCEDCEKNFGDWDNYAQDILDIKPKNGLLLMENSQFVGYKVKRYRYDLLKLFFISLLWRASVSGRTFYSKINLGPLEHIAKKFIENRDPGTAEDFSVTLAKFDHFLGETILDPDRKKIEGLNYYRFYLGGYIAYIKADKRRSLGLHADLMMKPGEPLIIVHRDLNQSKELPLIQNIVLSANKGRKTRL